MKYRVFHDINPTFGFRSVAVSFPEKYMEVAHVECDSIEKAFEVTNHIDHDWTTNPEVKWHTEERCRSTSVGDVIVDENGNGFRCENVGWELLGNVSSKIS